MNLSDWRNMMVRQVRDETSFNKIQDDKEFLSWLAGFIDGEGTFIIFKRPKRGIIPMFVLVNTDIEIMKYIYKKLGIGSFYIKTYSDKKRKPLGRLQVTRQKEILSFLPVILPYLKIKQYNAERMYNFVKEWYMKSNKEREPMLRNFDLMLGK